MPIPKRYLKFQQDYPDVAAAYEAMGEAVHSCGPLDNKTRTLIKLAISIGSKQEGAVHSHTKKAIKAGCSAVEIKHAVMLAMPTLGLPTTLAAMSWVEDIIEEK